MYGGTKEEMKRLIADAAKMDKSVDANSLSFANMVKAINVIQKDMNIYGTTSKEAEKTVTGSLNAMKASWGNLLTAIGSGENLDQCLENMISSVEIFGKNLMPVVERALGGLGTVVEKLSPVIAEKLPTLISTILPPLVSAAGKLVGSLVKELPAIIKSLTPAIKEAAAEIIKALYEAFTGKEMSADTFEGIKSSIEKVVSAITKSLPVILGLVVAFKAFSIVKSVASGVSTFAKGIGSIANKVTGGLGEKISGVGDGISKTSKTSKKSSQNLLTSAKAFALMGVGVLAIAVAFGILAFSAIQLANAGGAAIATMFGLVIALAALGVGMMFLLKSLSSVGAKAMKGATAMVVLGAAIILVAAGFALLAFSAIALANAGPAAIATMFGMIAALAVLMILAAVIGSALTGAAVGLLAFGAAILMVGLGALLAAASLAIISAILPTLVQYGLSGSVAILALGGSMLVFAVGAYAAGIASVVLGAGILVLAAGLLVLGAALLYVTVAFVALTVVLTLFTGLMMILSQTMMILTPLMIINNALFLLFTMTLVLLTATITILVAMMLLFSAAMLPLSATMLLLTPTTVLFTATMSALMAVFLLLSPMALLFSTSITKLKTAFSSMNKTVPKVVKSIGKMPSYMTKAIVPAGLLTKALKPLAKQAKPIENVALVLKKIANYLVTGSTAAVVMTVSLTQFNAKIASGITLVTMFAKVFNTSLLTTQAVVSTIFDNISDIVDENISNLVEKMTKLPKQMGNGLESSGRSLGDSLVSVWKEAVKASVQPVNKVLEAANWILKEFGSKKRVITWTPYANGTDGHKGGNALVNDGRGAELVQMPNGNTFIPQGRNVFLPNAPKGMKVLPAGQTARLMGRRSPTFRYADGIGNIDLWSFFDNSKGLTNKISESVSYEGMSGFAASLGKGMVSTFTSAMSGWVNKLFNEEGGKSLASYVASKGVEQWRSTVVRALKMEGQYSLANVKRTLFQMQTESGGNPRAINLWDSNAKKGIPSKGLMQVIDPTFNAYARKGFNKNIYDPLSNILASVRYATSRYGSLSNAYRGVGYAKGVGTVSLPTQTSSVNLSYTPESDSGYYSTTSAEYNTYAPQFSFTISGTSDDRAIARKVKRAVVEAWNDMLDNFESKHPQTQRV